jgi:hypothetical protein
VSAHTRIVSANADAVKGSGRDTISEVWLRLLEAYRDGRDAA